ncbi:hypothetical protein [Caldimonas brevitalea]|uniref:Uncharacterized protein n=1 Tax=Caldimonas brevitalea TaxID=413882 RepID=A0A0G3BHM4_9BURK|nr:hypothetical protein [Caldimonas brevitalea]AKJ28837.1 hypothetical protein AAW51_2146 [Caldimonas brevitalea]
MSFYTEMAQTAQALLQEFGAAATISRQTPGEYDPAAGAPSVVDTSQNVAAAVFPYGDRFIDGTLILAGDQQAFVGAVGATEPQPGDTFLWAGTAYKVIKAKILGPAGSAVLYELQVRRG